VPIPHMGLRCFIFEQWANDGDRARAVAKDLATRQRKRSVRGIIAGEFEQSKVRHAVGDPADPVPVTCARAHRTRLSTRVQRRLVHPVDTELAPCTSCGDQLDVRQSPCRRHRRPVHRKGRLRSRGPRWPTQMFAEAVQGRAHQSGRARRKPGLRPKRAIQPLRIAPHRSATPSAGADLAWSTMLSVDNTMSRRSCCRTFIDDD